MKYYSKKHSRKTVDKQKCNWLAKENTNKQLLRIKCWGMSYRSVRANAIFTKEQNIFVPEFESLHMTHRVCGLMSAEQDCVGLERLLSISHPVSAQIPPAVAAFPWIQPLLVRWKGLPNEAGLYQCRCLSQDLSQ